MSEGKQTSSAARLAARAIELALQAGFDRAGIASLEPSAFGEELEAWLAEGAHAGMAYMERRREERLDPRRLVPGARSAVCVALAYGGSSTDADLSTRATGKMARYARGEDYHRVMSRRLERLARSMREQLGCRVARAYVDTGPVLERELAARAGLGAIGKNTNLLHPELGSYFLLGELFVDLDLAAATPFADLCGSCTACLEACPTGALPRPFFLDSERCISFWTIESREEIPAEVAENAEGWVFGCDICQEVCPWNREERQAPPWNRTPPRRRGFDLASMLRLGRAELVERYRHSALKRPKLEGLRRNAAAALGALRSVAEVGTLIEALDDPSSVVRSQAAWALARIGGRRSVAALTARRCREEEGAVRRSIERALEELASGPPEPTRAEPPGTPSERG